MTNLCQSDSRILTDDRRNQLKSNYLPGWFGVLKIEQKKYDDYYNNRVRRCVQNCLSYCGTMSIFVDEFFNREC